VKSHGISARLEHALESSTDIEHVEKDLFSVRTRLDQRSDIGQLVAFGRLNHFYFGPNPLTL